MNKINLHIHTKASDGIYDYQKIIMDSKILGLKIISITDHDNVEQLQKEISFAKKNNICLIPGVELTADYPNGTCHILGYNFDIEPINEFNKYIKKSRILKAKKIIKQLTLLGYDITYKEILKNSNNKIIGKHDIAKYLVLKNYFYDEKTAIKQIFSRVEISKIKTKAKSIEECISIIKKSNGFAILAHPWTLGLNISDLEKFIIKYKFDGIEVYNHNISDEEYSKLNNLATKLKIYKTFGTDYHGTKEYNELITSKKIDNRETIEKLIAGDVDERCI